MELIWIYIYSNHYVDEMDQIKRKKINNTIEWLYRSVNDICYNCNLSPIYNIRETTQITYTDKIISSHNIKGTIYFVIWDEINDKIFDNNTLLYAMLHEISHILSPSIHHEPPFDSIESLLLNKAIDLAYYDPNIPFESNYMTLDITYTSM